MSMVSTPCAGCIISMQRMRTSCFWCGSALPQGRLPSANEQYETSDAARQARQVQIENARRDPDAIDELVAQAIVGGLRPGDEFTHDFLIPPTGLNPCAIKHALLRLSRVGKLRASGQARLRANRFRTKWQALPLLFATTPPPATPPAAPVAR